MYVQGYKELRIKGSPGNSVLRLLRVVTKPKAKEKK